MDMDIGIKNSFEVVNAYPQMIDKWDFAVNEECFVYGECAAWTKFKAANKRVFQVSYLYNFQGSNNAAKEAKWRAQICPQGPTYNMDNILRDQQLTWGPYWRC
jgi:hypothetical protein